MSISIRKGYCVDSKEEDRVNILKEFESKGIISLEEKCTQICKTCYHPNTVDKKFSVKKRALCANCGKNILLSQKVKSNYKITKINYKGIIKICDTILKEQLGKNNCSYNKQQRSWICSFDGQKIPVFIPEVSSYNYYVSNNSNSAWIAILIDWETWKKVITYYNGYHFIKLEDVLQNRINFQITLNNVTTQFSPNINVSLAQQFETYLHSITPAIFEKEFVDRFFEAIKAKSGLLTEFLNSLTSRKKTILNCKVVKIGGPGTPDFIVFNLLEYLEEAFKPDKVGEVKRFYTDTQFTVSDFGKAAMHAVEEDTVSIVSTNNIQPEVWRLIWDIRRKLGYYKHIILERDTILLLISVLKLKELLE